MFKNPLRIPIAALLLAAAPLAFAATAAAPSPAASAAIAAAQPAVTSSSAAASAAASAAPAAPVAAASAPAGSASAPAVALAPGSAASAPLAATLDGRVQDVKSDVIKLNRDLLVLEEELLFPANTQVALFVSMDVGKTFELDSVQVKLDDKVVASYLYTPLEVAALHRGGVQRVWLGNLRTGEHELVAYFTGKGPHDRDYKRGATVKFDKGTEAKYIELRIQDSMGKLQPEFDVKLWQ
ncbi:MAG: AraC family transcriptional regulator [Caldimonas sp.]